MKTNVLIADDDMDIHQLMCDVLEICLRDVRVERALSPQSFWAKLPAPPDRPWHLVFLSAEYVKEEPAGLVDRLTAANPDAAGKIAVVGAAADAEACAKALAAAPFLAKPFSLDTVEELVKRVCCP